jgi:hypothetical protein
MSKESATFDAKVAELVALCRPLDIPHILTVRRMTLDDPESRKWATEKQLSIVFTVILSDAMKRMGLDDLDAAAEDKFDPLLPPIATELRDQDRWLLFDLSRPLLANYQRPVPVDDDPAENEETEEEDYDTPRPFVDFATLFDETLTRYMRKALRVLALKTSVRPHTPPPFYLAPRFGACFADVLAQFILPQMRKSRSIKDLGTERNWSQHGAVTLIAMVQSGDTRSNPILHQWDTRWAAFQPDINASKAKPALDMNATPWPSFLQHAAHNEYVAPDEGRIWILRQILRWEAEALAEGWEALRQLYTQEFEPASKHDRARPGAFRDGLIKWIDRLPAHGGEVLATKAYFELPKCDRMFMRTVLHTFGMSSQRRNAVPLLMDFVETLPK